MQWVKERMWFTQGEVDWGLFRDWFDWFNEFQVETQSSKFVEEETALKTELNLKEELVKITNDKLNENVETIEKLNSQISEMEQNLTKSHIENEIIQEKLGKIEVCFNFRKIRYLIYFQTSHKEKETSLESELARISNDITNATANIEQLQSELNTKQQGLIIHWLIDWSIDSCIITECATLRSELDKVNSGLHESEAVQTKFEDVIKGKQQQIEIIEKSKIAWLIDDF